MRLYTPPHLRIEEPDINVYARDVITRQLDKMDEDEVASRTISFVTSNLVGWGKKDDPHVERLKNLLDLLRGIAQERALEPCWQPLASLHEISDKEFGACWRDEDAV